MHIVQCKVQLQHIYPWLPQYAKLASFRGLVYQRQDFFLCGPAIFGDPVRLVQGGGQADVRIKAAGRVSDQVGRYGQCIFRVV